MTETYRGCGEVYCFHLCESRMAVNCKSLHCIISQSSDVLTGRIIIGALAKLRKSSGSLSIRLSPWKNCYHWMNFRKILSWAVLLKSVEKD
jgi:hypothetical protein